MSVPVIKSRIVRWAGHVARNVWRETDTGFWLGNLKDRDYLEDKGVQEIVWEGVDWIDLAQSTEK